MKRIWALFITGVVFLFLYALYTKPGVPEKMASYHREEDEARFVSSEKRKSSSPPFLDTLKSGIENNRIAQEKLNKEQTEHYQELLDQKEKEDQRKVEEAAYWKSRQEWIEQFPFKPTYHASIIFDPSLYDPFGPGDLSEMTEESERMAKMVRNHGFLKAFYENPSRYSPEFERICQILTEEGLKPDPMLTGWLFTNLADYHKTVARNSKMTFPPNFKKAWGDNPETFRESILGTIKTERADGMSAEGLPTEERALKIRKRLINEIPSEGFLKAGWLEDFTYNGNHVRQLKAGDPILIR